MKIIYSTSFLKRLAKLPLEIERITRVKIDRFREYPHHMGLKAHKLHGSMNEKWVFSINYKYRIIYTFVSEDTVCFLDIGTHDIYD
jgi:addiction module RelE/StbE family toxin